MAPQMSRALFLPRPRRPARMDWLCFFIFSSCYNRAREAPGFLDATRDRLVSSNIWYNAISDQLVAHRVAGVENMRKGEQTRQEIIRKAAPIFNQRGYDGAALLRSDGGDGSKKAGIYRHFDSKQQLAGRGIRLCLATDFSTHGFTIWIGSRIPSTG